MSPLITVQSETIRQYACATIAAEATVITIFPLTALGMVLHLCPTCFKRTGERRRLLEFTEMHNILILQDSVSTKRT